VQKEAQLDPFKLPSLTRGPHSSHYLQPSHTNHAAVGGRDPVKPDAVAGWDGSGEPRRRAARARTTRDTRDLAAPTWDRGARWGTRRGWRTSRPSRRALLLTAARRPRPERSAGALGDICADQDAPFSRDASMRAALREAAPLRYPAARPRAEASAGRPPTAVWEAPPPRLRRQDADVGRHGRYLLHRRQREVKSEVAGTRKGREEDQSDSARNRNEPYFLCN
jgi:hypothetical protein